MTMKNAVTQPLDDYRSKMQAVAEGFLRRHWGEQLENGQLFERCCNYLVNGCDVPQFMAQRLVYLAMSSLVPPSVTVGWDMSSQSDATVVALIDRRDGTLHVVPRRILPNQFLAASATQ